MMKHILAGMAVLMAAAIGASVQAQTLGDQVDDTLPDQISVMIEGFRNVILGPRVDTSNSLDRQLEEQKRAIAALERKLDEKGKLFGGMERKQSSSSVSSREVSSLPRSVSSLNSSSTMARSLSELERKVDDLARKMR